MHELITYGTDRRLAMTNGEAIRKLSYGTDWTTIQIGLQYCIPGSATLYGGPHWSLGVCAGTDGVLVPASTVNAIGLSQMANNNHMNYNAGPPPFYKWTNTGVIRLFQKKLTAFNWAAVVSAATYAHPADPLIRGFMMLQLTKDSSTLMSARFFGCAVDAGAQTDVTDDMFRDIMELGVITGVAPLNSITGSTYHQANFNTTDRLTVTDGDMDNLDSLWIHWSKTAAPFTFNIRHNKF